MVVRLPGKDTGLLGIDRAAERDATEAAARAGVGPEVVAFLAEPPCLVTAFIPGRPVEAAELRVAAAARRRRARRCARVHDGPALPSRFDAFAVVEDYRATAAERGARIPPIYARAGARARARSSSALARARARAGRRATTTC